MLFLRWTLIILFLLFLILFFLIGLIIFRIWWLLLRFDYKIWRILVEQVLARGIRHLCSRDGRLGWLGSFRGHSRADPIFCFFHSGIIVVFILIFLFLKLIGWIVFHFLVSFRIVLVYLLLLRGVFSAIFLFGVDLLDGQLFLVFRIVFLVNISINGLSASSFSRLLRL